MKVMFILFQFFLSFDDEVNGNNGKGNTQGIAVIVGGIGIVGKKKQTTEQCEISSFIAKNFFGYQKSKDDRYINKHGIQNNRSKGRNTAENQIDSTVIERKHDQNTIVVSISCHIMRTPFRKSRIHIIKITVSGKISGNSIDGHPVCNGSTDKKVAKNKLHNEHNTQRNDSDEN